MDPLPVVVKRFCAPGSAVLSSAWRLAFRQNSPLPVNRERLFGCIALFAINAAICRPLFRTEYLDNLQSTEGAFITFGKFLLDQWPHTSWFPWFNAGVPFENTYLPLVSALVAIFATGGHCSPALAFHFLAALAYSAAPAFLFLFAARVSGRWLASFSAALLWSLLSPSLLIPRLLKEMGTPWGLRRLRNVVFFGETPHNLALCLLPIALLLLVRYLERMTTRRFAVCVLATAAIMLTNAFGIVTICVSSTILVVSLDRRGWMQLPLVGGVLLSAYLVSCRFLTPSLIRVLWINSQAVGGDFRITPLTVVLAASFLVALAALCLVTSRFSDPMLRFAVPFSAFFGGVTLLSLRNLSFLPQPLRYHLEMEVGLCLTAAFALNLAVQGLPRRVKAALGGIGLLALASLTMQDVRFARTLIKPLDITRTVAFRQARWIAAHLPGQRVFVAGEGAWWFNLFTDNPQLSGGHEPSAPNWMQRVAVYTIYTGKNAGDRDAEISVLWLKAFGCGAVTVPDAESNDHYHAMLHPAKFDRLLPLLWRDGGDSIYQVPLRSASLAHVVPSSAIVARRPMNGLDVDQVRRYVAALEDPAVSLAALSWKNPERGQIRASVAPGNVISLQITYDPGWRAAVGGRGVPIRADQLGLIVIEPRCSGECLVDLEFTGGTERFACLVTSLAAVGMLLAALCLPRRRTLTRLRSA